MKPKPSPKNAPVRIEPASRAASNALAVHLRLPPIQGRTPGERINFLHALSVKSGVVSVAAAIYAGWELAQVREKCTHGSWYAWLEKNTAISPDTALRYIGVYAKHLAEARAALPDPVPSTVPPSAAELEAACANTDAKTLTALYIQQGLVKRSSIWGGAREGAGRPPLLPTDSATGTVVPDGLHRAAVAAWGKIDRLSSRFLAKKFDLALTLAETTVALGNLRALVEALEKHKKELEPKERKGKR